MVKAIRFHEFGGPEVLKYEDVDVGDPGPGEIRLRHTAIGFNFLDALVREGKYPVLPELPSIPGGEAVGVVEAAGEDVDDIAVGQRIAYAGIFPGAYSEGRLIKASEAVVLPDSISDEDAAASFLKGMTVEYLVNRRPISGYSGSIRDRSSERRWVRTSSTLTWRMRRIPERCPPGRRSSGQPLRKRRRRRPRRAVAQHVQPAATFCMYRL